MCAQRYNILAYMSSTFLNNSVKRGKWGLSFGIMGGKRVELSYVIGSTIK